MPSSKSKSKSSGKGSHASNGTSNNTESKNNAADQQCQGVMTDDDQDPAERRLLRQGFRQLMEETDEMQHDLNSPDLNAELSDKLARTNSLFKNVKKTREATMDSALLVKYTTLIRKKANNLQTDLLVYKPVEFAEKLVTYLNTQLDGAGRSNHVSADAWRSLGEAVQPFFKRSPPLRILNGLLDQPEKVKTVKVKEKAAADNSTDKRTDPTTIKNSEEIEQHESTTEEVERVYSSLVQYYEQWGRKAIDYFEFVTNPHSFGQTVENIFYTSFLAKDGYVKINLDEAELPAIVPIYQTDEEREERRNQPRKQFVLSLSYQKWKEIVETYQIEEPLIPTRKQHADAAASS